MHVFVEHTNATVRNRLPDRPWRVRAVNTVGAGAEIQSAVAKWVHRMATRYPVRQAWIFRFHFRCRRPRRVDVLMDTKVVPCQRASPVGTATGYVMALPARNNVIQAAISE